jgi:starch synthase
MVISPRYEFYDNAFDTGVRQMYRVFNSDVEVGYFHCFKDGVDFVFVDHSCYHNRKGGDIYKGERLEQAFRHGLLCKAALEAVWHVPCGGVPYGDSNTIFIANDWHTAVLPVYLQVPCPATHPCCLPNACKSALALGPFKVQTSGSSPFL